MKIAYVITRSDAIGGAQVHVRDLATAMRKKGHKVTVLVGGQGVFTEALAIRGIPHRALRYLVRPIRPWVDVMGLWELRSVLAELKPDLVSAHSSKAGWLGRLAARSLGIPVIFTAHGWAFTEGVPRPKRMMYAFAERMAAPLSDRIITVSEYDFKLALSHRIAKADRLVVVHNGIPDITPALRAQPENGPVCMVMVARFEHQKDHGTLIHALAELKALEWKLELIGDGPLREQVKNEVEKLGLHERVSFLGARKDVAERLAKAQIFVLTSKWEGFPRSILEAMRAGLPVIASDVGGVREAVIDGQTGYLIPRGDQERLQERLKQLILNHELRAQMGTAGRRRYEKHFTIERMVEKTLAVYEDVVARRRKR
ncbi:glycosyltransferase family 4 protein [Hydrogenibacillus sp. N12]|uniref:glycosyltransferase family 4 protein n=1 Tax=Hydrogenibacillus sp. N12 TaxID=2866627 RepID=UPI001C7CCEFC|nr:glycosyltransferase family 4 protein [Hydrogenibacillus sp. N12]QZA32870.1 glycosyltransferase family 4 protein [Hydrogenibacillus sp. N12]